MKATILSKNGLKIVQLNRRKAIREKCLNCSGWKTKAVDRCSFSDCPLYSYRSGQGKQNAKERSNAIKAYCLWCMVGVKAEIKKCVSETCPLFHFKKG